MITITTALIFNKKIINHFRWLLRKKVCSTRFVSMTTRGNEKCLSICTKQDLFQFRGKKRQSELGKIRRAFLKKIFNGRHGRCFFGLRSVIDAEIKDEIAFEIVDYFAEHIEKQQASYRAIFRLQVKKNRFPFLEQKIVIFSKFQEVH